MYFFNRGRYIGFFLRCNAIAHFRLQYNENITLYAVGNQKSPLDFIVILWQCGTEPATSLGYACTFSLATFKIFFLDFSF